jgi:hypothetical protein
MEIIMTYKIDNIGKVLWKISKQYYPDTYEQLLDKITKGFSEYTGWDGPYSEQTILELCYGTLADYIGTGMVKPYQINQMFKDINGDPIIESIFGKDERSLTQKQIYAILDVFRFSEVLNKEHEVLIDFWTI